MSKRQMELYIGLMSGTSLDGIDAVLLEIGPNSAVLRGHHSESIPTGLKAEIEALNQPGGEDEIHRLMCLDRQLGAVFAHAAQQLLLGCQFDRQQIKAIGSHGQTIRHTPPRHSTDQEAYTLQIGDPATIVEFTGITTVADFRRRDIAAGGQGAPLVPAFHEAVFTHANRQRVIVNIGGMANITLLPGNHQPARGFDTGPGNILLDAWCHRHQQQPYDRDGAWAQSGKIDRPLLAELMEHPFFQMPPPKSTGRESFNLQWLQTITNRHPHTRPVDVQATLLELTACTITTAIEQHSRANEVFICGGGAYNKALMQRMETLLHPRNLASTLSLGVPPEWVEACAFAWLAQRTIAGQSGNAPAVTGARGARILGAIFPA